MNRCAQIGQEFILHEFQHGLKQHNMVGVFGISGGCWKGGLVHYLSVCVRALRAWFSSCYSLQTNPKWWLEWGWSHTLIYSPAGSCPDMEDPFRALLEEEGHWRWALRFYSLASLPVLLLLFASWGNEISLLPDWARSHFCYSSHLMMDYFSSVTGS